MYNIQRSKKSQGSQKVLERPKKSKDVQKVQKFSKVFKIQDVKIFENV